MISSALQTIYGDASAQIDRYAAALDAFRATYGPGDVFIFRAPGRVNLIGEHTDYNHGYVMPAALDKDILFLVRPRSDAEVHLVNLEKDFSGVDFTISQDIPLGPVGDWGNYVRGSAQALARQLDRQPARQLARDLQGLDSLVVSQPPGGIPRSAGLSSSSALTVAAAVALAHLNGWDLNGVALAQFCSDAEWYVGTRGGIMDQFASVLARRDHALFLDCRPGEDGQYTMEHVPLPGGYSLLIVNSGVRHSNVGGDYNRRVAACRAGVRLLQAAYPAITHLRDVEDAPWSDLESHLPEAMTISALGEQGIDLGDMPGLTPDTSLRVRARCRHVWTENWRVKAAIKAMRAGEIATLGHLLNEAHASARDDYEISCPEIEVLVHASREVDGVVGARLTGAGWGGCIVALAEDDAVPAFEVHICERYLAETGQTPEVFACHSGPGAGFVAETTVS